MFAAEEQARGDGLVRRIAEISVQPGSASHEVLPLYQQAAQDAYGNAARHGEQPR